MLLLWCRRAGGVLGVRIWTRMDRQGLGGPSPGKNLGHSSMGWEAAAVEALGVSLGRELLLLVVLVVRQDRSSWQQCSSWTEAGLAAPTAPRQGLKVRQAQQVLEALAHPSSRVSAAPSRV